MELILIAIALAMDSVAVSIASGSKYKSINFLTSIKVALFFGIFQGLMPLIGYFTGTYFASFVDEYDHYIAFIILIYLGLNMIKEAREDDFEGEIKNFKNKTLFILAIATSIDALAVGITFSFNNTNIWYAISLITLITFVLCVIAIYIGKSLGGFLESKAEYLGGFILVILGFKILLDGLNLI
ncbi:MAG: manganese efflux pump MntP family protein [Halarcobacter sp.]